MALNKSYQTRDGMAPEWSDSPRMWSLERILMTVDSIFLHLHCVFIARMCSNMGTLY